MSSLLNDIETLVLQILNSIDNYSFPELLAPKKDANVVFNTELGCYTSTMDASVSLKSISMSTKTGAYKFDCMLRTLSVIHDLLKRDVYATKRELFYTDPNLFKNQRTSDETLMEWSRIFSIPRDCFHIMAEAKGVCYGDLVFWDGHHVVNCKTTHHGVSITPYVKRITDIRATKPLKYILVVEKDAALVRLIEDNILEHIGASILITGCGFPDFATRAFLSKIAAAFPDVPVLGLADADPYGLDILCKYRFGSTAAVHEADLAVPRLRWIGVTASDLEEFNIPRSALLSMTECDLRRGKGMLGKECWKVAPEWEKELEKMIQSEQKAEIQSLLAVDGNLQFLSHEYIPKKLNMGQFI
ncbi:hypothetical protein P9112_010758 [Eukaryota sp. TZLM1-RC]